MGDASREDQTNLTQDIEAEAVQIGRRILGRDLTPAEATAMNAIFTAAAQALSEGVIERLANHVLAERREETIEEFFEDTVKTD
jgi:hypothetical protein